MRPMKLGELYCPLGKTVLCNPYLCACSTDATEIGDDGRHHVVGRKCGITPGFDSYIPESEVEDIKWWQ